MSEVQFERGDGWQALSSGRLRVEFRWRHDRWGHVVAVRGAAGWQPLLVSVELSTQPGRSPCCAREGPIQTPALQQLYVDTIGGRTCALGVGQAGAHHFAATFSLDSAPATLWVDVADRRRRSKAEGEVVSAYEVATQDLSPGRVDVQTAPDFKTVVLHFQHDLQPAQLRLRASGDASTAGVVVVERGRANGPRLCVRLSDPHPNPPLGGQPTAAGTRRWVYSIDTGER
jgi:hypothetical protein